MRSFLAATAEPERAAIAKAVVNFIVTFIFRNKLSLEWEFQCRFLLEILVVGDLCLRCLGSSDEGFG